MALHYRWPKAVSDQGCSCTLAAGVMSGMLAIKDTIAVLPSRPCGKFMASCSARAEHRQADASLQSLRRTSTIPSICPRLQACQMSRTKNQLDQKCNTTGHESRLLCNMLKQDRLML